MDSNIEVLEGLIEILNSYDGNFTAEDLPILEGINKILNDAEFERLAKSF